MRKLYTLLLLIIWIPTLQAQEFVDERKWYIPDHVKMQFAGNIGFISGGPGYITRNQKWQFDVMMGFVPKKLGGDNLFSITPKITYAPWKIYLGDTYHIEPLSTGIYFSRTFGGKFGLKWPSYYPEGYYWWATALRPGIFVGSKLGTNRPAKNPIQLYYEVGTYDLMMVSYVQNTQFLKPWDILSLAIGVRIGL